MQYGESSCLILINDIDTDTDRIGLDWIGLDWIGLDWIGYDTIG